MEYNNTDSLESAIELLSKKSPGREYQTTVDSPYTRNKEDPLDRAFENYFTENK